MIHDSLTLNIILSLEKWKAEAAAFPGHGLRLFENPDARPRRDLLLLSPALLLSQVFVNRLLVAFSRAGRSAGVARPAFVIV
jgi:hypothetical protein